MKKLRFEKLELLSSKEQKARLVEFHPDMTVIIGANDVGKSSIIKSLYWAFGAEPAKIHPSWVKAHVMAAVSFTVDDVPYKIIRIFDSFGVFDGNSNLLLSTSQVTNELAPFIGRLLDFGLIFTNRQGNPEIPPPAFAFLPFYIDQDGGWTKPLDSFSKLGQYTDFRKALLEFHTGILPNEYYELDAKRRAKLIDQKLLEADRTVVRKAIERFRLQPAFDGMELSIEGHERAIENLLLKLRDLRQLRQERAKAFADVLDQRVAIDQQVKVVRASITEMGKDISFAGELPDQVYCPTCGTTHANDFANRYRIIEDREACFQFLIESQQRLAALARQAEAAEAQIRSTDVALREVQASLDAKRGDVTLQQVIDSRSRVIAASMFESQIADIDKAIGTIVGEISEIVDGMAKLKDKSRRDTIVNDYTKHMLAYLEYLDVVNFDVEQVSNIPATISDTGSDLPRSILAYFLAIVKTIYIHSTSVLAPIIIDSPNQQDQDRVNVGSMIDLISLSRPKSAQVILGTVSLHDRTIESGKIIEFTEKKSVLRKDEYESVLASVRPLRNKLVFDRLKN